jgi:hypothetical protein
VCFFEERAMPACRSVIKDALRALKVLAPGDMAHIDQLNAGLAAMQNLVLELHEARGALRDVDVTGDWIAGEDQRVRVQAGASVTVTLPNAVAVAHAGDPWDYGFAPGAGARPPQGSTGAADGVLWRAPRDGARIEIVGATQGLWFYRADLNQWLAAYHLALDSEIPLNARYAGALAAVLAERLIDELAVGEPTPGLARRALMASAELMLRTGTGRGVVRAEYF